MILALDIGNSQIYGGLIENEKILLRFRKTSKTGFSSDEFGIFLRMVLKENNYSPQVINEIALCSVVPEVIHSIRNACKKYFNINPFILEAGVKTGLKIKYKNPLEVGADRIANSIAATFQYKEKNLIIVDLGTATTFCAINKAKEYLGGVIIAGLRLSMESLEAQTSKLPSVEIVEMQKTLGQSTVESLQSGLFYGHLGQMREITKRLTQECFQDEEPIVIGTGGFSSLFETENVFHSIQPDLVLMGLVRALQLNNKGNR